MKILYNIANETLFLSQRALVEKLFETIQNGEFQAFLDNVGEN